MSADHLTTLRLNLTFQIGHLHDHQVILRPSKLRPMALKKGEAEGQLEELRRNQVHPTNPTL